MLPPPHPELTIPLTESVLSALRQLLPARRPLALHEPCFGVRDKALTLDCLDSGWVSSVGQYVDRFEQGLIDYTGIPHAIATVSGTAALHTCLVLADVVAGDEVLVPALTFIGTANPVVYQGAVPHFVDCETETLGVDPQHLGNYLASITEMRGGQCFNRHTDRPIKALIVVHVLGHPARISELVDIAKKYNLVLIEDAAESLGSWRDGQHTGSKGHLAALSFNGNKIITCGGGGAVLTGDPELACRAKHLTTTAKLPHPWSFEHDEVGYNYRLPNLNAALGCAQLEQLSERLVQKRKLAQNFANAFSAIENVRLQTEPESCNSNYWLNLLLLPDATERDKLLKAAHAEEILLRPFWTPLHLQPAFVDTPRMPLPQTEALYSCGVCLPGTASLPEET